MSDYFEPFEATNQDTKTPVRFFDRFLRERKSGSGSYPVYVGEMADGSYVEVPVFDLTKNYKRHRL